MTRPGPADAGPPSIGGRAGTVATILIVEDDPAVARLLEFAFRVEGHDPSVLHDGAAACDRLAADAVDLVVLDLMLPEIDGYRVLEALRARAGWQDTKVLLLTALTGDHNVWKGWSGGADYYLTKPFDLPHLRVVVERLLAGDDLAPDPAAAGSDHIG